MGEGTKMSLLTREPTVEVVMEFVMGLVTERPRYQSQVNDALRAQLPGVSCNTFGEAVATLLRDGRLRVHEHRYLLPEVETPQA